MIKIVGFLYLILSISIMKKALLLILAILCTVFYSFAQKLNTTNTFNKALTQAIEKNKPILLIVAVPRLTNPVITNGVNVKYTGALENKEVIEKINETFVVYRTVMTDTAVRSILSRSSVTSFPAYVFLRPDKNVFYKDFGNFSQNSRYFSMIDSALNAYKLKPISELENEYNANKEDIELLKKLIDARKKTGINNNAELIEQYVNKLKIGDFNDYKTVLYILEAGPYTNGNAYKYSHSNQKIIDSIYKKEPLQKRMSFNNFMINNTMNDAIKGKNFIMAQSAANFTRNTWNRDYQKGAKAYDSQLMRYYLGVKDTAQYLQTATYHYDNFYMRIGADSIKKIEAREREALQKRDLSNIIDRKIVSKERMDSLMKLDGKQKITQTFVTVGSTSSNFANELNNAAWTFYQTGTRNLNYLTKAMLWSRRSIELNPIGGYYDTLAHLLYRLGYFEEAIKTQEDAIEKSKLQGMNPVNLQAELKKMKARQI